MKKRILSGILALTMCFSMTPSIAWGSGMTEFSDGASGESEKKEEFTDEPEIEEEKEKPVAAAGVPEVENGFSDGTLDAAQDTSATTKHTVTIDTSPSYKIGTDTMYDVINNHDGTLTVGVDPEIKASLGQLSKGYSIKYRSEKDNIDYTLSLLKNPELNDDSKWYPIKRLSFIPERKINITNIYTLFCVVFIDSLGGESLANYQRVENPIKVNYDSQGGSGEPNTDWVWNGDGRWNTDRNTEPTKEGYKFAGWYTQANGNGSKIEEVSQAVNAAVAGSNDYKEITLYAKWVHEHTWQYRLISSGSEYTFKAYCSNANSPCEYYGTSYDDAKATVSLKLEGFDNNKCVEYGNSYSVTCANSLPSEIGVTIGQITYADRNRLAVWESETPPTSPGKYKAKVVVRLPGYNQVMVSADFEIKPRPVQLNWSNSELTYNGQPQTVTAEVSNFLSGDTFTLKYENNETYTNTGTNAQKYRAKIIDLGNPNYSLSEQESIHSWEIKKASTINSASKVSISGWTYGGYNEAENTPSIDPSLNPENQTVQYTYYTDGACSTQTSTENGAEAAGGVPKNAGTYYVKAQIPESANYNAGTATGTFEIKAKEVTVKPDDLRKHIGEKDPKLTYTTDGIVEGETLSGITLQRESGEDARKYTIKATETEGANPNYTVTRKTGTFTIEDHKWQEDGKILSPATSWSEGMKERTCTAPGCGQKRYDAIPKQDGKPADPYADKIDKYIQIFGSEITAAALDNEEIKLFELFPESDKTRIDNESGAKVWLEINHVNNLDPDWQNLINTEIEKTVGKNADRILFDIDLYRQLVGENRVLITDPCINMNIRIKIPDKMINNQPYTIREYKIFRLHKDSATNQATVDILDPVFNSSTNEITFKSDKFSIYVLTYKDTYYSPSYPVTGIKVSPDTLTLTKKDETAQLTAEVTPSYADNKRVTWQSSDEKVATVDENGKVTAVGNGTATITATSVSGSYTATVSVTVKIPVEIQKLTIEAEKETLTKIGESTELKVKIEPENADLQKLIWKSDNEKVATTDENGKVTAVGNGTAEITVTTEDGKITASIMITVKVPDEPTINKSTGFRRLRARSVKQTKTSVTLQWNIIKDADGYFIYGNRCNTGTKSYKYRKLATITGGDISTWTQKDLKKGTYYKYVVKAYRLVNGKKVVTDTSISVHAVTGGGKYGNAKAVSVTQIGNKKNVSKITLKMGKTAQIQAKEVKKDKKIARHRKLCYESSNTKVATVTPDGLIRATGKGTCTIWVYAQNGVYKALKITVK
ncbi:MAG: Ig-like domain-containing protein [Blautia wexlerae]